MPLKNPSVAAESVRVVAEATELILATRDVARARARLETVDLNAVWRERGEAMALVRGIPGDVARSPHSIPRVSALVAHERNRFTCRYDRCGFTPTVDEDVLKALGAVGVLDYYRVDRTPRWHVLAWTVMAAPEHVIPRSPDPEHWTTACWTCNSVKSDRRLEDLGWQYDPEPPDSNWMGLRDRLGYLEELCRDRGVDPRQPIGRGGKSGRTSQRTRPAKRSTERPTMKVSLAADETWEDFSFERSSIDAATRAADEDGIAPDDERRVGKTSSTYDGRRGYSVPPIKIEAPQLYGTLDGRWRMFDAAKHPGVPPHDPRMTWVLQRRVR